MSAHIMDTEEVHARAHTNPKHPFTPRNTAAKRTQVHEGDVEGISVMVCKNAEGTEKPLALKYNQHEWDDHYDCSLPFSATTGRGCNLTNGTHPVGYIALESHATYAQVCVCGRVLCAGGCMRAGTCARVYVRAFGDALCVV